MATIIGKLIFCSDLTLVNLRYSRLSARALRTRRAMRAIVVMKPRTKKEQ